LEPGVEGLVHVSEMSWTHEVRHPSRLVAIGDQVEAAVLNVDPGSRKISLGMKQTAPNPWDMVEGKYPAGTRIEGKVKSLTDFGAFIGLDEGIDGLIHISDMSWTKHIKHPSELFKKGQKVEAVVLRIDKEKERLSLGYKQLGQDPWDDEIPSRYRVGDSTNGKVSKVADFGIFVELDGGVEGLIHISEAGLDQSVKLEEKFKLQDDVVAKIIKVDREERKIALSLAITNWIPTAGRWTSTMRHRARSIRASAVRRSRTASGGQRTTRASFVYDAAPGRVAPAPHEDAIYDG